MSLRLLLQCGWRLEGSAPTQSCVVIAAPHTSNWDFVWMILMATALGMRLNWFGKDTLFNGPLGMLMRPLGGIAVHRDRSGDYVAQMAKLLSEQPQMLLAVPAEGTRARREYWHSGFYYIAKAAAVPVVFSYLDYGQRRGGIGPSLSPSADLGSDMDEVRAFYQPMRGKYPEHSGPIRLQGEE